MYARLTPMSSNPLIFMGGRWQYQTRLYGPIPLTDEMVADAGLPPEGPGDTEFRASLPFIWDRIPIAPDDDDTPEVAC